MKNTTAYYCVYIPPEKEIIEIWAGPCSSKLDALSQGEMSLLDCFGSRSKKYAKRINNLVAVNEKEAKYLKLI